MAEKLSRECQKCGEVDITEFTTCRYCKTRYVKKGKAVTPTDVRRNQSGPPSNLTALGLVVILALVAFVAYHFVTHNAVVSGIANSASTPHRTVGRRHR